MKKGKLLLAIVLMVFYVKGISQISPAQNITLRSNLKFAGQACANIWGYAAKGREYALVGTSGGSAIVDVTNPDTPRVITQISAVQSAWREIKSYRNYAYLTTEGSGQGLQIINLSTLPDSNVAVKSFKTDGDLLEIVKVHSLHIDTAKGFVYLYGGTSRVKSGVDTVPVNGAVVLDIKTDPWNPKFVGFFNNTYIHDGIVENDTLYGGHVYNGYFSVIDFKDKKNPKILATQTTPNAFTHNTWLSANHKTIFTTDETAASYLTAYDITDISNIKLLDKVRSVSEQNAIVHNTYILNEYAVTSWYTEGVTIVDAHRPKNLIQVGQYDTYSLAAGASFHGAWGVYPYLPSGNLIVSNIEDGLFVLTPQYKKACYLEGEVIDSVTRVKLSGVRVKINWTDPDKKAETTLTGTYATGQATPGQVTVTYSKLGYFDKTLTVSLKSGEVVLQNVELAPRGFPQSGSIVASATGVGIPKSKIVLKSNEIEYSIDAAANGSFYFSNVLAGTYSAYVGAWGYLHKTQTVTINSTVSNYNFRLEKGYQDDFWGDFAWEVSGAAQNASQGRWELGVPIQSTFNNDIVTPATDMTNDIGEKCYVTGIGGGQGANTDVDATTILTSPAMDLSNYKNPVLTFSYWYYNGGGAGTPPNDKLKVYLSNGVKDSLIFTISESQSAWRGASVALKGILPFTNNMRLYFNATDDDPGHIMEVLIDDFKLQEPTTSINPIVENWEVKAFPNPFSTAINIDFQLDKTIKTAELTMTNVLGQVLERKKLKNTEGVVSMGETLPTGLYFIQIEAEGKVSRVVKVMKE